MQQYCDLHTHSIFSDGTDTPQEILQAAVQCGLSAVALCDHNTTDGLLHFLNAAKDLPIEAICGAEFSVDYNGTELHLLGLFLDPKHYPQIMEKMAKAHQLKEQSNLDLIKALNAAGYPLDYEQIKAKTPNGRVNRAHIAAALTEKGFTPSMNAAFNTLLSKKAGFYKEPQRITVWEMLSFLRSIDAVPVLAHPYLNLTQAQLEEFLPQAKEHGLIGIETVYSLYDADTTKNAAETAKRFGLLCSGGSDYHGSNKPDLKIGVGKGNLAIPLAWANALKESVK